LAEANQITEDEWKKYLTELFQQQFKHLGINVTSFGSFEDETNNKANPLIKVKANKIAGYSISLNFCSTYGNKYI